MPWRAPEYPGEFPSMGWTIVDWIQEWCVIPDGDYQGQPYILTPEMVRFIINHYRVKENADAERYQSAFYYRRSQLVRSQKWGKGPVSAAIICAEAVGPVLFDGWDAGGEPVGRPWPTPLIQITAASEDQTDNVYRALLPMIQEGNLADMIPDTGDTRINLPGGGRIDPVTSAGRSRLGQRVTFCVQDETGTWTKANGGQLLADTQRRGLAGMGGRALETTNSWDPAENSVAQQTAESRSPDVYRDHTQSPAILSYGNKVDRHKIHKIVYGDSWWVDLDRIDAEAAELAGRDLQQAERFFGNRIVQGLGSWLPDALWSDTARLATGDSIRICAAFDGSNTDDWTAIRAETTDGWQFTPTYGPANLPMIWDPAQYGGQIPRMEVHAAVEQLFAEYDVVRMYCDPPLWSSEIEAWALRYGERVVLDWETYRPKQMFEALSRFVTDLQSGAVTHDGCPITATHVANARRVSRPGQRYVLGKPHGAYHQKIDAAVASVLAHEAAADVRALPPEPTRGLTRVTGRTATY